jgi:ketosteroid isomerase-like protein
MENTGEARVRQVLDTIDRCWAAYEANSQGFFDFFTEDVSIFSASLPTRLQGREAYRQVFGPQLGLQKRASHIFNPEIRLLGDGALASYHSRIRTKHNSLDSRITLLLVPDGPDGEDLKIAHMHLSPLTTTPSATGTNGLVEDVAELAQAPKV